MNDRSWRGTTQGSVTTLRPQQVPNNGQPYNPQQGSTSSRAYTPRNPPHQVLNNGRPYNPQQGSTTSQAFIPRNTPQAARTPASAPRPRTMNTGFNGSMATVHENEPQPQLLSIPVPTILGLRAVVEPTPACMHPATRGNNRAEPQAVDPAPLTSIYTSQPCSTSTVQIFLGNMNSSEV